jgi:hypothetical protein
LMTSRLLTKLEPKLLSFVAVFQFINKPLEEFKRPQLRPFLCLLLTK